tara:strand:+ start:820 stop:1998 length:1179 start_codon:yes stop_codon:yes gene_type:complete
MNNLYNENGNPFIQSNVGMVGFGVSNVVAFDLAPTNATTLAGGLGDSDTATSTLQEFIPEIWGASIMDYMEKNLVFGRLSNDLSALVAAGGDTIHLPKHTELTASDTYGGGSVAVETLIDTNLAFVKGTDAEDSYTLSLNQAIHSAIAITDVAKVQAGYDVMKIYTEKLGYALAKKIDAYISLQLFEHIAYNHSHGTGDGNGAGNTVELNTTHDSYDIIAAGVSNMMAAIHANDSNIADWTMVLTPKCYASLFKLSDFARYEGTALGLSGLAPTVGMVNGYAGKLAGVDVVVSTNFNHYDAGAATTTANAVPVGNFSADGVTDESEKLLGYLIHKNASNIAFSRGMKARVQSDYHLPSLSSRFVADSVFGCTVTGNATDGNKRVFALVSPAS